MPKIDTDALISGNQKVVRRVNRASILNAIREKQPISRAGLSKLCDLNRSTVSSIVNDLLEEEFIYEGFDGESTGGRKPILLRLRKRRFFIGAIDIDPDISYIAIGDLNGNFLTKRAIETPANGPEAIIHKCVTELEELIRELDCPKLNGVGISIPGIVAAQNGMVVIAPDLKWNNVRIIEIIENITSEFNSRIIIENEANSSALAEQWFGTSLENESSIVFISEGIGTGLILERKLIQGSFDFAGQFGHMTIHADGDLCVCGNRGCWELYTSNAATVQRYHNCKKASSNGNQNEEILRIIALAKRGDGAARKAIRETGRYLGIGISNIIKGIDPGIVVLGGSIIEAWDLIYPEIMNELESRVFFSLNKNVKVIPTSLKERSSLVGAITLVIRDIFSSYRITK